MLKLSRRAVLTGGAALGTIAIALPTMAAGSGTPANKAVAAGASMADVTAVGTTQLLKATFKSSKPTDLLMSVSLECSLFTKLLTNNTDNSATAGARLTGWLEINDGPETPWRVVRIESASAPPQEQTPSGDPVKDGVTFCDREYSRTVTDDEDPLDGTDSEEDFIRTKSTHGFNWVLLNAGSGIHEVRLMGTIAESTDGQATADAIVGKRTMIIEPTKMANDAVIAENGTS